MPDLERIQQNTPVTISKQWYEDGAPADPSTVTLGITRADGTALVAAGTATSGSGTNPRTFNLTTTHTALLDRLKVTWTSSTKGMLISYVEVVGGFLFTIDAAEQMFAAEQVSGITVATIIEKRTLVEQMLEDACEVAFVPRYERETVSGNGTDLLLKWPKVRMVRAATVGGTALTAEQLAELVPWDTGVYWSGKWTKGRQNVTIDYEHGHDYPPGRASEDALLVLKNWVVKGPVDDRTTSMSTDDGTFALATPGMRGSFFGLPEVDAFVEQYGMRRIFA